MRADVLIDEVLAKCDVLKRSGLWLPEPHIRPRAWINNFEDEDKEIASLLLDRFTYYNARLTDKLLVAAYLSIGDGLPKGPQAPDRDALVSSLSTAVFTPVRGEVPSPTDSGNYLCRKARQVLGVQGVVENDEALVHARHGRTIVFVDDFIGSGDQFIETWRRDFAGESFETIARSSQYIAIYVTLIATAEGLDAIHTAAPKVAICATHVLDSRSTIQGMRSSNPELGRSIDEFLHKYIPRLRPSEHYISQSIEYLKFGYMERGLLFGFEHSIPDATLPIFWSAGTESWEPLLERT